MYTIVKQHVTQFKTLASTIKVDDRMPILQYILVTVTPFDYTFLKNGLGSYLEQRHEQSNAVDASVQFLIEESTLYNFAENAPTDHLEIVPSENTILLRCINWEMTSPTEPVAHYPVAQPSAEGGIDLSGDVLKQIGIAANYIVDEEIPTPKSHVFIGKGYVGAGDSSIVYLAVAPGIEGIVFKKNVAEAVGRLAACQYMRTGNYDIFKTLNSNLGFIKPEINWFDLTSLVGEPPVEFVIDKADLIRFCNSCINITPTKLVIATMEAKKNGVLLKMNDAAVNKKVENIIPAQGAPAEVFKFNVANMLRLLKGIPDDQLNFAPGKKRYYINGAGFNSLIMALG